MADYIVNFADPLVPAITIHPRTVDGPGQLTATTSLRLFGNGHTNWGEAVNENFVRLLETFMGATAPASPVAGQLWAETRLYYRDTNTSTFYRYDIDPVSGTYHTWVVIPVVSQATAPSAIVGNYWFNTTSGHLMYYGSANDGVPASWMQRVMVDGVVAPTSPPSCVVKAYNAGTATWDAVGAPEVSSSTSAPTDNRVGTLRYDAATDTLYVWNGTQWVGFVNTTTPSFVSDVDMNNHRIINLADAVNPKDGLNLQTGDARYVNVAGDTMTGNLNLSGNQVTFANMFINEGNGDAAATGPDIRFTSHGMLAAAGDVVVTVDHNNLGTGAFVVSKGGTTTNTHTPLLTINNSGEVRSSVVSYETLVTDNNSLTNKKYVDDKAAATISTGKHTIWVPAAAITSRLTSGAGTSTVETGTNKVTFKVSSFSTSVEQYVQFFVQMPKSWDESTVTARAVWSHSTGAATYGVVWGISAVAFTSGDALDVAFGTEQLMVGAGGTANALYRTAESSAITVAGAPAAEDVVAFQVVRRVGNAGDTLEIDARLHGIVIYYNTNAVNDA